MAVAPSRVGSAWTTYYHTITQQEAALKKFDLPSKPKRADSILLDIVDGGGTAIKGVHFSLQDTEIHWSGHELDGVLSGGDRLRIAYV